MQQLVLGADATEGPWKEYRFKVKAGDVNKKPRFISPYHYRLDWCMWIAQFAPAERNPWLYRFMLKLVDNDGSIDSLLERGRGNPFAGRDEGPKYIRVERWKYSFATGSGAEADALPGEVEYGDVWRRERLGIYAPKQDVFDRALLEDTIASFNEVRDAKT